MHYERWKHHGDPLQQYGPTRGHHTPHTEESKRKMGEARKGRTAWNKGKPWGESTKEKLRQRVVTEETRQKLREGRAKQVLTEERNRKVSESNKGKRKSPDAVAKRSGKNHWNWKDGASRSLGRVAWRELRERVLKRDGNACTMCGRTGDGLIAHHIVPFNEGGIDSLENLATVCRACHMKIHRDTIRQAVTSMTTTKSAPATPDPIASTSTVK
jgi:5-methylcytosine-specific restriction endonuclease McrA